MKLKGFIDQVVENGIKAKSTFPLVGSDSCCLIGRGENCDLRLGTPSQVLDKSDEIVH